MFLIRRYEKLDKEVSKEHHAYPQLNFHELGHLVEGLIMECVNGNADYKED